MNITRLIGIILIVCGIAALATGGFSFTQEKQAAKIGPLELKVNEEKHVGFPAWASVVAIVAGGALVIFGGRRG